MVRLLSICQERLQSVRHLPLRSWNGVSIHPHRLAESACPSISLTTGMGKVVKDWSLRSVQSKLIKIGGRRVRHARRLVFQLAEETVPRALFQGVLERIGKLSPGRDQR